ncbi:ROK family protein [Fulvivirga kasyanovii]|uniref:ROK family protein n=1 Tax=Fulvivirga kasyanovii TaxID=396812 RepID=A0ABW9RVZ2_9BACT|nr:ROK family protein [Fulvivirga kasyanovii]MTI28071.1 ROK family protein [Fulvivirga kasyanovii]
MKELVAGIDIGGTGTKFGLTDREGNVLSSSQISSTSQESFEEYLEELHAGLESCLAELNATNNGYKIVGIGVGAPNGNYYKGTIDDAPNLRWRGVLTFVEAFKQYYDVPIILTNDANAAALGEMLFGGAKGLKDFVVITLGTGLGSGFVVNGELLYGYDGFAGEVGHTIVDVNGRECGCGRQGCLETYVSAPGLVRTVQELLGRSVAKSALRKVSFEDMTSALIAQKAQVGDAIALRAFDYTAEILGLKLADLVAHTSPETIFLFGGLANAGDILFDPVRHYTEKFMLNLYKDRVKILPSAIGEQNAAILGAAALIWHDLKNIESKHQNLSIC